VARFLAGFDPAISEAFLARPRNYCSDVERLLNETTKPTGPPYLFAIRPLEGSKPVGRLEKARERLVEGAISGMDAVITAITENRSTTVEVLRAFNEEGRSFSL